MKLDQQPDGWHLRSDEGLDIGPFESLTAASDYLDLVENRQRLNADTGLQPDHSRPTQPTPGFWGRMSGTFSRTFGFAPPELPPGQHRPIHRWTASSGR